jgi:hypothetical protein
MNHMHEKQDTAALWVQYNDLVVPVFGAGISSWMGNGARAAGVPQQGEASSGNDEIVVTLKNRGAV